MEMIRNHPGLFKGGAALIEHLRQADELPNRPPTAEAVSQDEQARMEWAMQRMDQVGSARGRPTCNS